MSIYVGGIVVNEMDLKNTGIWSPMQTWWFMRRMDWKVADVHENAIINMCERSTVGNRPHQMQSWALAMRCGYALAKDLDQVLCKETPPEQCTQCSWMIFSNWQSWNKIITAPPAFWAKTIQLCSLRSSCWTLPSLAAVCESHEEMLKDTARVDAYRTCGSVSWQWRGLLMVEEFRTCLCLSQLSFWM